MAILCPAVKSLSFMVAIVALKHTNSVVYPQVTHISLEEQFTSTHSMVLTNLVGNSLGIEFDMPENGNES